MFCSLKTFRCCFVYRQCSPFQPKFHMEKLDEDTVALLSRRAYDVAASTRGVKVFLNGKRIPVKVI